MNTICGECFGKLEAGGICPNCGYENKKSDKEVNSLDIGTMLNQRYIMGRVLGVGGFGITYKAYDSVLGHVVAIKEYLPNEFSTRVPTQAKVTIYTGDKREQFLAGQKRFIDEARKLAKFQHRDEIVHIFDFFDENNTSYIVMEFLDGRTLQEVLKEKEKNRIDVEEAVGYTVSILDALNEVHAAGILHRDIAPDNVFLTKEGKVKLIDFGAARYATTTHSKSLSVIIKQGYAPIEQYRSKGDQGPWTDVYGVAATLYKMITGITPDDSLERSVKDTLKRPSKLGVAIDKHTENALMNALNVPIEARPADAAAFKNELLSKTVKRKAVKIRKEDVGNWPIGVKIMIGTLAAAAIAVLVMIQRGQFDIGVAAWNDFGLEEGKTRVPNIVNTDLDVAEEKIEAQTLEFVIVSKEYSSEIPKNKILVQSLTAGSVVDEGSKVEVTVSGGEEAVRGDVLAENEVYVPDVQYKTEEEAVKLLEEAGLKVKIEYEENDTVEVGHVIRQEQDNDVILLIGSTVTIIVCKEPERQVTQTPQTQQTQQVPETPQTPQTPVTPPPTTPQTPAPETPAPPADDNSGWQTDFDLEW